MSIESNNGTFHMFLYLPNRCNPMDKIKGEENSTDMDKTVYKSTRDLVLSRIIDAPTR